MLLKKSITTADEPPRDSNTINSINIHNVGNKSSAVNITDGDRDVNNNSVKETNGIETNKSESSNGDSNSNKSGRCDGNTNKKSQPKNVSKKSETKKKKIYVRGDSVVKHIKDWDLSAKLDHRHNTYVRNFPGAKVRSMKDYTKLCTREENPDHIILYVGTNDLISDNSPE